MIDWNIDEWAIQMAPSELQKEPLKSYMMVMASALKVPYESMLSFYTAMLKQVRYNGQTIVMENLLNDLFDMANRDIQVITSTDLTVPVYISLTIENDPIYVGSAAEGTPVFVGLSNEYGSIYDFIILVPNGILTTEQEIKLKTVVNYYKLAGKRPQFIYQDNTIF
jgi:hypothetical protein